MGCDTLPGAADYKILSRFRRAGVVDVSRIEGQRLQMSMFSETNLK